MSSSLDDVLPAWEQSVRGEYSGFFPLKDKSLESRFSAPVPHTPPNTPPDGAGGDYSRAMVMAVAGIFAIWILSRN